jgi:NodT family efflux transporter outer membrane factor (OMF) lipoprotein
VRRQLTLGATLMLAIVAGCTAGPDYHLPDGAAARAPAANGPFVGAGNKAFVQAPLPPRWWHLYDDPRLDAFEEEALAANTDLRAADANLRRATFAIREQQAARTVQTDLSGVTEASQVGNYTLPTPGTAFAYSLGISLSYPLDLSGQIRRGIEAARDNAEAVAAARDQTRVTVAAAVARNYIAACSANVTLAATQRVLAVQRQTVGVTRRLQAGGRGTAFDVTRAQAALDQSAAAVPAILAARRTSLFALAALLGRPAASFPREVEGCAAPPRIGRPLPIGDGAALIRRRPDIRQAERMLAAATATVGVETSRLYPQVSLGGSAGVAGPFGTLGTGSAFGGSLGPLISWNFPNRQAVHARIGEAGAAADMSSAQFDGTVLTALRQSETALEAYAREIERDRALEAARDDADRAAGQANRLFRFGRTGLLEVLTAQATLATAETTLAQSRATLADRQVDVFLALGGGWD